jgi:membrane-associated phospholipid phosphatase
MEVRMPPRIDTSNTNNSEQASVTTHAGGALRNFGFAATAAAIWLAVSVGRKPARQLERKITPRKEDVPMAVRVGSRAISFASYPGVYLPLTMLIAKRLRAQRVEAASAVPKSALLAWLSYHAVKTLTHRERPPSQDGKANDDRSYPSGHATAAAAIATSAAYLMLQRDHSRWTDVLPAAVGVPLAIGASRVAIGKHWPTDVLGGFVTGAAVAAHTTAKHVAGANGREPRSAI